MTWRELSLELSVIITTFCKKDTKNSRGASAFLNNIFHSKGKGSILSLWYKIQSPKGSFLRKVSTLSRDNGALEPVTQAVSRKISTDSHRLSSLWWKPKGICSLNHHRTWSCLWPGATNKSNKFAARYTHILHYEGKTPSDPHFWWQKNNNHPLLPLLESNVSYFKEELINHRSL